MLGMNNERMASYNKRLLLFNLFRLKEAHISELASLMGMSVTALSKIVRDLETSHVVEIVDDAKQSGLKRRGRQAGLVRFCHSRGLVICVDVRPQALHSVLCDVFGQVILPERITPVSMVSQEVLLGDLEREIKWYRSQLQTALAQARQQTSAGAAETTATGEPSVEVEPLVRWCYWALSTDASLKEPRLMVALALHGQVDSEKGVSLFMPQVRWHKPLYVKYLLEQRTGLEVEIDNDCVMRTLAQKWFLLRQTEHIGSEMVLKNSKLQDFCVINLDYGIGSSFIINQEIYRGSLFGSGQIGHTILNPHGLLCSCGRHGCLETMASVSSIMRRVTSSLSAIDRCPEDLSFAQVVDMYLAGDEVVRSQVNRSARSIGLAIYNFLNVLNINHIYLYGALCALGNDFLEQIMRPVLVNPFDAQQQVKDLATFIEFGSLSPSEQIAGISYLYGERFTNLQEVSQ